MHFLPQGSPLSHRSHASRERLKVTIKSPPPPAPPCSLSLLPSHSHSPSGHLRTVQILCHPLLTAPFAGNLDVPSWLPRWERSWFSFPPSGTCDSFDPRRRLSLSQACLISFSVAALCLSFRVSIHFILFFNLVYAGCPSSQIRFLRTRDSLGPWSATLGLILRRRPLTTVGRPSPTAVAESQWGEPRSDASGTSARVAGSLSQWLVLLPPSGQPLVLAVCGRSILTWHHCGCQ